jgi:hypothetical protein
VGEAAAVALLLLMMLVVGIQMLEALVVPEKVAELQLLGDPLGEPELLLQGEAVAV